MIVEITGLSGSGKTALVEAVVKRLGDQAEDSRLRVHLSSPGLPSIADPTSLRRAFATDPIAILAATRLALSSDPTQRRTQFRAHAARLSVMTLARRWLRSARAPRVVIIDQGVMTFMRSGFLPHFSRPYLPDHIIELDVPKAECFRRRLTRDRPHRHFHGADRILKASDALFFLDDMEADHRMDLVERWSRKFCSPPLSAAETRSAVLHYYRRLQAGGRSVPSWTDRPVIRDTLLDRGLSWKRLPNSTEEDWDSAIRHVSDLVSSLLHPSD